MPSRSRRSLTARATSSALGASPCRQIVGESTLEVRPGRRRHLALACDPHRPLGDLLGIAGLLHRLDQQVSVRVVVEVDKSLGDEPDAVPLDRRGVVVAQRQEHELGVDLGDGQGHGLGQLGVLRAHRVERAVGLHMCESAALRGNECRQRPDLIRAVVGQVGGRDLHRPAPEAEQVRQGHVRSDLKVVLDGGGDGPAHSAGVAGVEPACDVRGGDVGHEARVVAEAPATEALTHVDVHVNRIQLVHRVSGAVDAVAGSAPARSSSR